MNELPLQTTPFLSRQGRRILLVLTGLFLLLALTPNLLSGGIAGYLPLHTTLEVLAVSMAFMIFAIGWRAWLHSPPLAITIIACGFLGVGILDIAHLLSYQGMPDFITPADPEKAINFWLASRLTGALTLLIAATISWRKGSDIGLRYLILALSLSVVSVVMLISLYAPGHIPATFHPDTGLTRFKVASEYVLVTLYLATSLVLWFRRSEISGINVPALNLAVLVTVLSELFFTLYADVTDLYNLMGHVYKITAYYYLYRALVVSGITQPSRLLEQAEQRMSATLDALPDMMFELDEQGVVRQYHSRQGELLVPPEKLPGQCIFDLVPENVARVTRRAMDDIRHKGLTQGRRYRLDIQGQEKWYELSGAPLHHSTDKGPALHHLLLIRDITARVQAEQQRNRSQRFLETALDNLPLGLAINSVDGNVQFHYMNDRFPAIYGVTREQLQEPDAFWRHVYRDPEQRERMKQRIIDDVSSGDPERMRWENIPLRASDGTVRYITAQNIPLPEDNLSLSLVTDVTRELEAERELRIAAIAFESQEAIIITDAQRRILRVNHAFTEVTGFTQEDVIGQPLDTLNAGQHRQTTDRAIEQTLARSGRWRGELWQRHRDGNLYPQRMTLTAVRDASGTVTHYVADLVDTTALHEAKQAIEKLSFYDPLTGLGNRTLMLDRLQQSVSRQYDHKQYGAALYIDLDNFKSINDTLGHQAGDILLTQVASRLRSTMPAETFIARNGADEFLVILENIGSSIEESARRARQTAERLVNSLTGIYEFDGGRHYSSCSIGITVYGGQPTDAIEILKQADIATNQVKQLDDRHVSFYDASMEEAIQHQVSLEHELRDALALNQFVLWYQPKVRHDGSVVGAEALIRWQHPDKGLISPGLFIPAAEASGQILMIEHWVLDTAIGDLKRWQDDERTRSLTLNVNVTSGQFYRPDFTQDLLSMIERHQVDPSGLVLEFTESTLIENIEAARQRIGSLREKGVNFAIDDFGTGYSSLAYLSQLPLDQLKIDQSFVQRLGTDASNETIIRAIIEMARALHLQVLAEGVETPEQLAFLRQAGCDLYQGYLFGRPVPIDQFRAE